MGSDLQGTLCGAVWDGVYVDRTKCPETLVFLLQRDRTIRPLQKLISVAWARERNMPTELPPLVGEVSANYCGSRGVACLKRRIPYGRILDFLGRSRYFFFQIAPQLYLRGWVDPVPDPLLLRKSGSEFNFAELPKNKTHYERWIFRFICCDCFPFTVSSFRLSLSLSLVFVIKNYCRLHLFIHALLHAYKLQGTYKKYVLYDRWKEFRSVIMTIHDLWFRL
jgi:hypothetical protein